MTNLWKRKIQKCCSCCDVTDTQPKMLQQYPQLGIHRGLTFLHDCLRLQKNMKFFKKKFITFDQLRESWVKGLCSADTSRQVCLTTLWNKKEFLHLGECELPLALFHTPCLAFDKRSITVFHNNFGGPVLLSSGKEEPSGQRGRSKATLSLYLPTLCCSDSTS